jgi:hypothetical protein
MRRPSLFLILLTLIALASCKKAALKPVKSVDTTKTVTPPVNTSGVYIAGYDQSDAVYWKDNKETILSRTFAGVTFKRAEAHAITIDSSDNIYVAGVGVYNDGSSIALLWKNGVPDTLARPVGDTSGVVKSTRALSIAISGNDIYVGGDDYIGQGSYPLGAAVLWKNGVPAVYGLYANSFSTVLIVNGDVYAAGCREVSQFDFQPVFFKNGVMNGFGSPHICWINDIFVEGSDVYIAGSDFFVPSYWINGVEHFPSGGSPTSVGEVTSIAINGSNTYMVGNSLQSNMGILWKNDTVKFNASYFSKVTVKDQDVYIIGHKDTLINGTAAVVASVWKNQVETRLSTNSSDAFGIYIH